MKKTLVLLLALFSINAFASGQDEAIHQELRQALGLIEASINSGDYDKMLPVFSKDFRATPITQEFIKGKEEVSPYFHSWFGPDKFLKKLTISFTPDVETELSADKTWGVVYGHGIEKYQLSDGRSYDFATRWTATVVLEDGHWKIRTIHMGTNFTDNPLLNEARSAFKKALYGAGAGGLLAGLGLGFLLWRKKRKSA